MSDTTGRLRAVREARGISIRDLAEVTGIDRGHLSRIERGEIRPSVRTLSLICRAIGLRDEADTIARLWP